MKTVIAGREEAARLAAALKSSGSVIIAKEAEYEAAFKDADLILVQVSAKAYTFKKFEFTGCVFDGAKAGVASAMAGYIEAAEILDKIAVSYKKSGSKALIVISGEPSDLAIVYLDKKHGIASYATAPKSAGIASALETDIPSVKIGGASISAAGVRNMLWVYAIKDKNGKDILPVLKKAAEKESVAVSRFELTRDPVKSLAFYGYYHSAHAAAKDGVETAAALTAALGSETEDRIYLYTINGNSIYGLDGRVPVCVSCKVGKGKITPFAAQLPLQCVLASNDYAGALMTSAEALSKKSAVLFKRAVKLDPYIASLLTLEEADVLAESMLADDKALSAYFGR